MARAAAATPAAAMAGSGSGAGAEPGAEGAVRRAMKSTTIDHVLATAAAKAKVVSASVGARPADAGSYHLLRYPGHPGHPFIHDSPRPKAKPYTEYVDTVIAHIAPIPQLTTLITENCIKLSVL